ncbi:hypothetical protein SELMODRAFT_428713 [Selaginella moellendorffii]|uniref:Uncharacterized protein n=1 Tax=Selaginella moellendorffii TaxID=88036 RepID=D8T3R6_SELML|nr:hypothetical protein SELMODRAFT_428713 [Selaginella moellendorffii]
MKVVYPRLLMLPGTDLEVVFEIVQTYHLKQSWISGYLQKQEKKFNEKAGQLQLRLRNQAKKAACCSGLLDPYFCDAVQNFSVFGRNVVCQDWSGIVAFMPGLIPDSVSTVSIVLAPGHRIPQLVELLQAFVDGLGLFEVKVTCLSEPATFHPELYSGLQTGCRKYCAGASTTWKPHRAVLVETDVLVSTHKVHMEAICSILWSCDVTFGIHSLDDVEDIVTRFCKGETSRIARPAFTVRSVKHFYAAVKSASDKLAKLGEVWKLFRTRSVTVTVYCNSVSQVELVASAMESAGFEVAAAHTDMPQHCIEDTNRASVVCF